MPPLVMCHDRERKPVCLVSGLGWCLGLLWGRVQASMVVQFQSIFG